MLSWGGEGSTVCFAELCIFKIIMIPGISLVLAEEGRVLHLFRWGAFPDVPPNLSSCQASQAIAADLLKFSKEDLYLFECFISFIKSETL